MKHVTCAFLALVGLVCAAEAALRIYDSCVRDLPPQEETVPEMSIRSWSVHHGLKPLQRFEIPHPDTEEPVSIVTGSFGLRGGDVAVPKPPGVYRVLCLGDDATLGAEVAETQTYSSRLQELLQPHTRYRVEVVNAGVPGYCPLLSYLQLRHSLLAMQPDLIILNFDMTDVADDHRYRRFVQVDPEGRPLACPHPDLLSTTKARPTSFADYFLLPRWAVGQVAGMIAADDGSEDLRDIDTRQGQYAWLKDGPPDWSTYIRQSLEPIDELRHAADHIYARLVVVVCPAPWQVSPDATASKRARLAAGVPLGVVYRSRGPFNVLAAHLESRGIVSCDLSAAFQSAEDPAQLFLRNVPRFSERGHDLYSRTLAAFLIQSIPGVWTEPPGTDSPAAPLRQAALPR